MSQGNHNEYPDELPVLTNDSCDCSSLECFFSRGITLAVLTDLAIFSCESLGCSILSLERLKVTSDLSFLGVG
jgi:hypothetical protein